MQVLHAGVGPLTQGDINLAVAAGAHLVTFALGGGTGSSSAVEAALKDAMKHHGVKHFSHNIVYHLMDELSAVVHGECEPAGPVWSLPLARLVLEHDGQMFSTFCNSCCTMLRKGFFITLPTTTMICSFRRS